VAANTYAFRTNPDPVAFASRIATILHDPAGFGTTAFFDTEDPPLQPPEDPVYHVIQERVDTNGIESRAWIAADFTTYEFGMQLLAYDAVGGDPTDLPYHIRQFAIEVAIGGAPPTLPALTRGEQLITIA
jgi:hypothetical protein